MAGNTINPNLNSVDPSRNIRTAQHMGLAGQGVSKTDLNKDSLQSEKPTVHRETTPKSSGDTFTPTAQDTPDDNLLAGFTTGKAGQMGAKQTKMDKMVEEHTEKDEVEEEFEGVGAQNEADHSGSMGLGVPEQSVEQLHQGPVLTNAASAAPADSEASLDDLKMNYLNANADLGQALSNLTPEQNMAVSAHYNNVQAFAQKQEESGQKVDKEQLLALSMMADPVLQDNPVLMKSCENFLVAKEKRDEAKQAEVGKLQPVYMEQQAQMEGAQDALGQVISTLSPEEKQLVGELHQKASQQAEFHKEQTGQTVDPNVIFVESLTQHEQFQGNPELMEKSQNYLAAHGAWDATGKELSQVLGDQPMVQPGGSPMMGPHANQIAGAGGPQGVPIAPHPGLMGTAAATAANVASSLGGQSGMAGSPGMGAYGGYPPGGGSPPMGPGMPGQPVSGQPGSESPHTDSAKQAQQTQQDLLGARQIYAQMAAERMKWMMQIWQIMAETQTKVMEIIQTVSARRAASRDALCQTWVKVLGNYS